MTQQAHVESPHPATDTKPVTWDNFLRAESDKYFKSYVDLGGFGRLFHIRKPTPHRSAIRDPDEPGHDLLYGGIRPDHTSHDHQAGYG